MVKHSKLFLALLFSFSLIAACNPPSEKGMEKADDKAAIVLPDVIKIGFIGPLTGNAASYGQDVKTGVALYFRDHAQIDGKPIEVIYEDGKCNGQDASNAAQKLINVDKVEVIIGGQCSGETLAAAPIAEATQVVIISPLSSSPEVTTAGNYIFRNYPSDAKVSQTLVKELVNNHQKYAIVSEQTDYAQGFRNAIKGHLEAMGKLENLVVDEAYGVDNTDFRTLLTKVKESGADALVSIAQSPVTNGFTVKQAAELGLKVQIYGTDTIDGKDFFDTAKDAAEGVKQIVVAEDPTRDRWSWFASEVTEIQASPAFPAFGYDAAELVGMAIEKAGYDGTAIKDYFNTMPLHKGLASDVDFDENGDNNVDASVKVATGGKFVIQTK